MLTADTCRRLWQLLLRTVLWQHPELLLHRFLQVILRLHHQRSRVLHRCPCDGLQMANVTDAVKSMATKCTVDSAALISGYFTPYISLPDFYAVAARTGEVTFFTSDYTNQPFDPLRANLLLSDLNAQLTRSPPASPVSTATDTTQSATLFTASLTASCPAVESRHTARQRRSRSQASRHCHLHHCRR